MEKKGIKVDIDKLLKLHGPWEKERNKNLQELKLMGGEGFNPNSAPDKVEMLKKCVNKNIKASNKDVLKPYSDNPIVKLLQNYGKYQRIVSTYSGPILEKAMADPRNRIHTTFNQVASQPPKLGEKSKPIRTGRFSSSNPNLQNIHAKDDDPDAVEKEEAHPLRSVFVPEDGHKFIGSDFSQIEYRLLAHDSQDPTLIKAYLEGYDIHKLTADTLGCSRKLAKNINFGIVYGAWPKKISELAGCSLEEAEEFIKVHEARFPNVGRWKYGLLDSAKKAGGVTTMWGRFIPIPALRSWDEWEVGKAERQVIDYRIQGSAAEILKMALIRLHRKHKIIPVLNVHDEIILETLDKDVERETEILSYEMENVIKLRVPLIAKASVGMSWAECK